MENPVHYAKRKMLVNDSDGKPLEKPETMYEQAMGLVEHKKYKEAIGVFDEIEELYPFSQWAQKAMIISAYLNYVEANYTVTEAITERFIDTYRNYKHMPYAYYLRAMSQYKQIRDIRHDHEIARKAYNSMLYVVSLFPHTEYAYDIEDKILLARYYLAAKDVDVGRFYMKTRQFLPAMLRFNQYLKEYSDAFYTPEILYRLIVCSEVLNLHSESIKHYALLSYNFPYSSWRAEADNFLQTHSRAMQTMSSEVLSSKKLAQT